MNEADIIKGQLDREIEEAEQSAAGEVPYDPALIRVKILASASKRRRQRVRLISSAAAAAAIIAVSVGIAQNHYKPESFDMAFTESEDPVESPSPTRIPTSDSESEKSTEAAESNDSSEADTVNAEESNTSAASGTVGLPDNSKASKASGSSDSSDISDASGISDASETVKSSDSADTTVAMPQGNADIIGETEQEENADTQDNPSDEDSLPAFEPKSRQSQTSAAVDADIPAVQSADDETGGESNTEAVYNMVLAEDTALADSGLEIHRVSESAAGMTSSSSSASSSSGGGSARSYITAQEYEELFGISVYSDLYVPDGLTLQNPQGCVINDAEDVFAQRYANADGEIILKVYVTGNADYMSEPYTEYSGEAVALYDGYSYSARIRKDGFFVIVVYGSDDEEEFLKIAESVM